MTRDGLFLRMKDEDWETVMTVNLTSAFRLSRAVLKGMMKRRYGRIINITSIVGVTGNGGQANYAASKAGLIGMSKSLAAEVATRNVTVNCIAPGFIASPMTDAAERQAEGSHSWRPFPPPVSARAPKSARPASIWPARKPPTSPARRCMSTAEWQ